MIQRDWEEIRRQWQRAKEENRPYEGPQIYVYTISRIVPATIRDVIPRGATVLIEDIKEGDYRYFPYQALHTKASLEAAKRERKAALQKTCVMCGKQFEAKREGIVCCSPKCSMRHAYQMKFVAPSPRDTQENQQGYGGQQNQQGQQGGQSRQGFGQFGEVYPMAQEEIPF